MLARSVSILHPGLWGPSDIFKGLLCCLVEDTPIVRRAYAGKAAELCAARSFGGRRANYSASPPTGEKDNVE